MLNVLVIRLGLDDDDDDDVKTGGQGRGAAGSHVSASIHCQPARRKRWTKMDRYTGEERGGGGGLTHLFP